MAPRRYIETAAGQGALLFMVSGVLGLLSTLVPSAAVSTSVRVLYAIALLIGVLIGLLPWERWHPRATLIVVPAAFALISIGQSVDPYSPAKLYALWFALVFCWIGMWHPARTSLLVAPLAAAAYVAPFLPFSPAASPAAAASVAVAIPMAVVLAEVLAATTAAMRQARCSLEDAALLLERANLTDDLTGLGNRRQANSLLEAMAPGDALVLLDLDHFKVVNDTRGHAEGDRVLMRLGKYLLEAVRDADCVSRFGGEEFFILLRGAGGEAGAIVERLVEGWRACGCGVTLSAGVAVHVDGVSPAVTLKRADGLLYAAKAAGRNRVVTEQSPAPTEIAI